MTARGEVAAAQTQASGSSFYAGMRVLPKAEREAMFAIYAFCRAVDDIADEDGMGVEERRTGLDAWRADLRSLYAGGPAGRAGFLAPHIARFGLREVDFLAVIDGMQMDVDTVVRAPDLEFLDLYCDRVASAVGRLSVRVFGMTEDQGPPLAHHLGRGLQLTNILRDLDEDAAIGRLYLAKPWLEEAGVETLDPRAALAHPRIDAAARRAAALAHNHYAAADRILSARPQGRLIAPRLMSAVYREILEAMEVVGWTAPRRRIRLGRLRLLWILLVKGVLGR